ncbi:Calcium-Binding And Coiled-Coil Domain-Containing Protein 2 [Manis pentadactyla]|nr:Calcium-Binding And Coiled-Coil Domain-Containing Protein 2 [Manis pentadactyla]
MCSRHAWCLNSVLCELLKLVATSSSFLAVIECIRLSCKCSLIPRCCHPEQTWSVVSATHVGAEWLWGSFLWVQLPLSLSPAYSVGHHIEKKAYMLLAHSFSYQFMRPKNLDRKKENIFRPYCVYLEERASLSN